MRTKQIIMGALLALGVTGCASMRTSETSMAMSKAQNVPAAEATVRAEKGEHGNTRVRIDADHLAAPSAVESGASTYVVWAQERGSGDLVNLGALRVGDDRRGTMEAITPLRRFDIFITPESSATADEPSADRMLWASLNLD